MFKRAIFELTEPLCDCNPALLGWAVAIYSDNNAGLDIYCRKCATRLRVPHNKFMATITLDRGLEVLGEPRPRFEVLQGGKAPESPSEPDTLTPADVPSPNDGS